MFDLGGFTISGRRLINKGWLEFDVGAGGGPMISMKGSRNLTNKVFCNGGATLNFRENGIIPGLVGSKLKIKPMSLDHGESQEKR